MLFDRGRELFSSNEDDETKNLILETLTHLNSAIHELRNDVDRLESNMKSGQGLSNDVADHSIENSSDIENLKNQMLNFAEDIAKIKNRLDELEENSDKDVSQDIFVEYIDIEAELKERRKAVFEFLKTNKTERFHVHDIADRVFDISVESGTREYQRIGDTLRWLEKNESVNSEKEGIKKLYFYTTEEDVIEDRKEKIKTYLRSQGGKCSVSKVAEAVFGKENAKSGDPVYSKTYSSLKELFEEGKVDREKEGQTYYYFSK